MLNGYLPAVALMIVAVMAVLFWNYQRMEKQPVDKLVERLNPTDYQTSYIAPARPHLLIDVRTPAEYYSGHIPGAVNIELDALPRRLAEIPQDQPVVIYCRTGRRSLTAARILAQAGYTDLADLGGIVDWQRQGLPLQ
jgi:phage shock protein E